MAEPILMADDLLFGQDLRQTQQVWLQLGRSWIIFVFSIGLFVIVTLGMTCVSTGTQEKTLTNMSLSLESKTRTKSNTFSSFHAPRFDFVNRGGLHLQ